MNNISYFLMYNVVLLMVIFLGGYLRLYLMAKMKPKTILITSLIVFVLGEIYFVYLIFS